MNESFRRARQTLHEILNPDRRQTRLERIGNDVIAFLIFANVLAVILESMAGLRASLLFSRRICRARLSSISGLRV